MNALIARRLVLGTVLGVAIGACGPSGPSTGSTASPAASAGSSPSAPTPSATAVLAPTPSAVAEVWLPVQVAWKATAPGGDLVPTGIVLDPKGRLWVTDPQHDRFAIFTTGGAFVEFWGVSGTGNGELRLNRANGDGYGAIAFATDGSFFVLDVGNRRVQKFDADRHFVKAWGSLGSGPGQYKDPVGIAIGPDGRLHVLDDVRGVVETYDADGTVLGSFSPFPGGTQNYDGANSLALDAAGSFYVSVAHPDQVQQFDPNGNPTLVYGAPGSAGAFHEQPGMMSIDSSGRLFVTQGPQRGAHPGVLVFGKDGQYLGGWGAVGSADGELLFTTGVLVAADGTVYVGDRGTQPDPGQPSRVQAFQGPPFAP